MTNKKTEKQTLWILLFVVVVIAIGVVCITMHKKDKKDASVEGSLESVEMILDNELVITKIGGYTGNYMEDATDEKVTDVLAIVVENRSEKTLQYTEITLTGESGSGTFQLSTLNPKEKVLVLETERKTYQTEDAYTEASVKNTVFFDEELSTYPELLKVQPLDGGFNITNISEEDITGDITVYFKDFENEMLMGGITYRGRIEGGLQAGEVRQIMTDNFTESNTRVMFITIIETEES